MEYTARRFYDTFRVVDRFDPKVLRGWSKAIPFVNLSDKRRLGSSSCSSSFANSGKIFLADATVGEMRAVREFGKGIACPGAPAVPLTPRFENRNVGRRA